MNDLSKMWQDWATHVVFALKHGDVRAAEKLMALPLFIALMILEAHGIQYGPRVPR